MFQVKHISVHVMSNTFLIKLALLFQYQRLSFISPTMLIIIHQNRKGKFIENLFDNKPDSDIYSEKTNDRKQHVVVLPAAGGGGTKQSRDSSVLSSQRCQLVPDLSFQLKMGEADVTLNQTDEKPPDSGLVPGEDSVVWSHEVEVCLFHAMIGHKPVGKTRLTLLACQLLEPLTAVQFSQLTQR